MSRQRLAEATTDGTGEGGFGHDLLPGEQRIVPCRNGRNIVITRTARPYVYDLADAYNASMSHEARMRGLEWYVDHTEHLKLGRTAAYDRQLGRLEELRREYGGRRAEQRQFADV